MQAGKYMFAAAARIPEELTNAGAKVGTTCGSTSTVANMVVSTLLTHARCLKFSLNVKLVDDETLTNSKWKSCYGLECKYKYTEASS